MSQIIVEITYTDITKKLYIRSSSNIGLILYDTLDIFNLLIYNIENAEFIFDDGSSIIPGYTVEDYKIKLSKHIADKKAILKKIILHDRRRDENMNVIKENIY
jgi:hypothetical protein